MDGNLIEILLAIVAAVAVTLSPYGRQTVRSVRDGGLTLTHARMLVRTMMVLALLVVVVAALNVR